MPDTGFTDYVTTIVSTWLNQANKLVFWGRRPNVATTTGSANAQILTLETGSLYSAGTEADGDEFVFLAGFTNAAAMTLQVLQPSGTNVARAVQLNGVALTGGEVIAGQPYRVTRKSTTWQLTSLAGTAFGTSLLQAASETAARSVLGLNEGMSTGSIVDAKGDIITATADNTPVRKAVGSNGQIIVADSTQSDGLIWTDFSKDPLNVNPNMLLDQINEGTAYTCNTSGVNTLDGWSVYQQNAGGTLTAQRVTDPDNAARTCLKLACTATDTSLSASDRYIAYHALEGYDVSELSFGVSGTRYVTVMMRLSASLSAYPKTYGVYFNNSAANRSYVMPLTITSGAETDYTFTFPVDTAGTWLYTNGVGLRCNLMLAGGTDYDATALTWSTVANAGKASGYSNFMDTNTNVLYIKKLHVIPGNVVCAYKPADIQLELAKAQRQYCKSYSQGVVPGTSTNTGRVYNGSWTAGTVASVMCVFPVEMRASPTMTGYNTNGSSGLGDASGTTQTANFDTAGTRQCLAYIDAGSLSVVQGHFTANARLS